MLGPTQKALEINLDTKIYGTFAEIGAGQEVVRHFFRAGGAAGTIAKSMSAYDMNVSNAIYGKSGRYVSLERLQTMLGRELEQLQERLQKERGQKTAFFSFANTVAAKNSQGNGWIGLRFQDAPGKQPGQVVLHVNMFDRSNLQQQEALGIIGVNLIYACYHYGGQKGEQFVRSLMEGLSPERIEIDMIEVKGPAFAGVDSRLWSLELVKQNFCCSVMFNPKGEVLLAKDRLYTKNILVCRGSYRPPTLLNLDMLENGYQAFKKKLPSTEKNNILILPEISMNRLRERGEVDNKDFLARINLLGDLGYHSMISNYQSFGELSSYLSENCRKKISIVLGYYNLEEIFDHANYQHHSGGLLGGLGDVFGHRTTLYCYPGHGEKGRILTSNDVLGEKGTAELFGHLKAKDRLYDLTDYNRESFKIWSREVLKMIQQGEPSWEELVPPVVRQRVLTDRLFGYPGPNSNAV